VVRVLGLESSGAARIAVQKDRHRASTGPASGSSPWTRRGGASWWACCGPWRHVARCADAWLARAWRRGIPRRPPVRRSLAFLQQNFWTLCHTDGTLFALQVRLMNSAFDELSATDAASRPVGGDLFIYCFVVYQAAASFRMPVRNPEYRPLQLEGIGDVSRDIPINRAMRAVMKELRELGESQTVRMATCFRLMHLSELLEDPRCSEWIKPDPTDAEAKLVAAALLRAAASARLKITKKHVRFDMAHVVRLAEQFERRAAAGLAFND